MAVIVCDAKGEMLAYHVSAVVHSTCIGCIARGGFVKFVRRAPLKTSDQDLGKLHRNHLLSVNHQAVTPLWGHAMLADAPVGWPHIELQPGLQGVLNRFKAHPRQSRPHRR